MGTEQAGGDGPAPGAEIGGPTPGLSVGASGQDGDSGMNFPWVWCHVHSSHLSVIKEAKAQGREATMVSTERPDLTKHHWWHGHLGRCHPSDSVTQFPAGSFPHPNMFF